MTIITILLFISLIVNVLKVREVGQLKKEHDYYVEVDDENERLRQELNKYAPKK